MDYIFGMRELKWDGYFNARDLGGLPTAMSPTGSTIFGRIARGPRRELITEGGWIHAQRWGLQTVVDLRCAYEIGRHDADPEVQAGAISRVTIVNTPTEDHENSEFREVCFPILDSPAYWEHSWRILPELVRGTLRAIAAAKSGVLVHCSAGRDRTGMISALLLGNAGVAPQSVVDDYAESVRAMAGAVSHSPTHDRQASWTKSEIDAWIEGTTPIVYFAALHAENALVQLGLTRAERGRLRTMLTQP
jgi:protein-tyrosine phosphatase